MTDLTGRTFCITGANTGIGRATAVALARRGGRVIVAGRTAEKMADTLADVDRTPGSATFVPLDLGDLGSVRTGAEAVLALDEPVHVLINNAGLAGQRGLTPSGFERAFGVNHLGHFLWTSLLSDQVVASATRDTPGRIVIVASDSHFQADGIDFDAVQRPTKSMTGLPEYAVSKLANVLHAQELARRLADQPVTACSLHPGVIASDIWRRFPGPVGWLMKRFMKSTEEGAETSVHCATAPDVDQHPGAFWDDCAVKPANTAATPELAAQLWERSEAWTTATP